MRPEPVFADATDGGTTDAGTSSPLSSGSGGGCSVTDSTPATPSRSP